MNKVKVVMKLLPNLLIGVSKMVLTLFHLAWAGIRASDPDFSQQTS